MEILCHRGFWVDQLDQNSFNSLMTALTRGMGIETDIRCLHGRLVISHDSPGLEDSPLHLDKLFAEYKKIGSSAPLALNIKEDGLAFSLNELIMEYGITNYFVFDMSIPDMLPFLDLGMNVFTRHSDIELLPVLINRVSGVWLDELVTPWLDVKALEIYMRGNVPFCIVSPELHKRDHHHLWSIIKDIKKSITTTPLCYICTDLPIEALRLNDQN